MSRIEARVGPRCSGRRQRTVGLICPAEGATAALTAVV